MKKALILLVLAVLSARAQAVPPVDVIQFSYVHYDERLISLLRSWLHPVRRVASECVDVTAIPPANLSVIGFMATVIYLDKNSDQRVAFRLCTFDYSAPGMETVCRVPFKSNALVSVTVTPVQMITAAAQTVYNAAP